jgi:hypothetical protein
MNLMFSRPRAAISRHRLSRAWSKLDLGRPVNRALAAEYLRDARAAVARHGRTRDLSARYRRQLALEWAESAAAQEEPSAVWRALLNVAFPDSVGSPRPHAAPECLT